MARKIDNLKNDLIGEVFSQTELENYMSENGFYIIERDESETQDDLIKFTNYTSQIWIKCEVDEENNILVSELKRVTKINNDPTRVEPFRSYHDLESVLKYFRDNKMYHHWFTGCLMVSLGRRVGDVVSLKWNDLFLKNGDFRERLTKLKEEKTGKIVGVRLNSLARFYIQEYCKLTGSDPVKCYNNKIFDNTSAAFRKALKNAVDKCGLSYPISTHSFRKYYANTIYKLHPQDVDNLMIVQSMMGHSDPEITKIYINEIDRKCDKYNEDYSKYMLQMKDGEDVDVSNSPCLSIEWKVFRDILSSCWDMAQKNNDKFDSINELIRTAENHMI